MNRPTWNNFKGKNFDNNADAFEALARLLFKRKYGIGDSLPYFKNNKGIETHPIEYGKDIIGFQAKFFVDEKIKAPLILDSLKKACEQYPDVTRFIVYTNAAFGNPLQGKNITAGEKSIEDYAKEKGIVVEWICGNDVLDLVQNNELAYNVFFNPNSNLCHLQKDVDEHNKLKLEIIYNCIHIGEKKIEIDHSKYVNDLDNFISNDGNIIISGESGSGKSAIVKSYCESLSTNEDYTFYILDASAFGRATNINGELNLSPKCTLDEFCMYFEDFPHKFIVIDSAEKLLNLKDSENENAKLFMRRLKGKRWSFVFTCRENSVDDVENILKETNITYDIISVEPETIDSLNVLTKDYAIKLPHDLKLLEQLTYPFYLARYCELSDNGNLTLENFREEIWKQKVRGYGDKSSQIKREQCLLEIVEQMQIYGYIVPYAKKDIDSTSALVSADILVEELHKGYFVKHDIYTDWAWYYIILRDFELSPKYDVLFERKKTNIQYINAFKTWFSEKTEKVEKEVDALSNIAFDDSVPSLWRKAILECIGRSECYVQKWFNANKGKLAKDNYKIFNEFINVLCVSCNKVEYIKSEGKTQPLRTPIGSGWDVAIDFIWEHVSEYYQGNLEYVYKLLSRFSPSKDAPNEIFRYAGLLSLRIFDTYAESRKTGEYCSFDRSQEWAQLVCTYFPYIEEELRSIFNKVVSNNWVSNEDPYVELISYILKINSANDSYETLFRKLRKEIISLMNLFWKEQPSKTRESETRSPLRCDNGFDLNDEFNAGCNPCSALQTPMYNLLKFDGSKNEILEVIDFIIDFVDSRVQIYMERYKGLDKKYEIEIKLGDGQTHTIFMSYKLWCLYRGINYLSSFMASIHMALEKYLLELAKDDKEKGWANEILWRILEKSHSCSLYSIVASLITAFPKDYYEQFIFMMQDVHFLLLDLFRFSHELKPKDSQFMVNRRKLFYDERYKSNKLQHREIQLSDCLREAQVRAKENGDELKQLHAIVDNLVIQTNNLLGIDKGRAISLILPIDDSLIKTDVKTNDNIKRTQYEPLLSREMQQKPDRIRNIFLWIYYRRDGLYEDAKKYEYDKDIQKALELIREIKEIATTREHKLSCYEELLPSITSALLLLQYYDQLNEKERIECACNVLEALSSIKFTLSSHLLGYEMCIEVIPKIMELIPKEYKKLQEIMLAYILRPEIIQGNRPCYYIYRMVGKYSLWDKNRDFMNGVLEKFKQSLNIENFSSITPLQAESLLCLLSKKNPLREFGKLCVEKISTLWESNNKNLNVYLNYYVGEVVTDYIIHAQREEAKDLIAIFKPLINRLDAYFLILFSIKCEEENLYDSFWAIWNELYDSIVYQNKEIKDAVINAYLLAPNIRLTHKRFNIEGKAVEFYKRIAKDMNGRPTIIYSIIRVFNTFGQKCIGEMIPTIEKMCEHLKYIDEKTKEKAITELEKMMTRLCRPNSDFLKNNHELKKHVENILISMRDNDSWIASYLLQQWV